MAGVKENNNPPLYKYHPVRFSAVRENYITEAMDIVFEYCFDGAYPIFELPLQTRS